MCNKNATHKPVKYKRHHYAEIVLWFTFLLTTLLHTHKLQKKRSSIKFLVILIAYMSIGREVIFSEVNIWRITGLIWNITLDKRVDHMAFLGRKPDTSSADREIKWEERLKTRENCRKYVTRRQVGDIRVLYGTYK